MTAVFIYFFNIVSSHSLAQKPSSDIITERQMMAKALSKKEIAQKKLAVNYFSLIMDLEIEQHQRSSYRKWVFFSVLSRW